MIQIVFFLRFSSQLERAREADLVAVKNPLITAFKAANADILLTDHCIAASFDEKSLGVWLNIIIALETGYNFLKKHCALPSGTYSFVVGKDISAETERVSRTLASLHGESGVWCDQRYRKALSLYCSFEGNDFAVRAGSTGSYVQIKSIEAIARNVRRAASAFPLSNRIVQMLKQEPRVNILFTGPNFIGKREGVYRYLAMQSPVPPLIIRFRRDANIGAFADMLNPKIHALLTAYAAPGGEPRQEPRYEAARKRLELLDAMKKMIFRERLRSEYSPALSTAVARFFKTLLDAYTEAARAKNARPVLVAENTHNADPFGLGIFLEVYKGLKQPLMVYGTCLDSAVTGGADEANSWKEVFSKKVSLPSDTISVNVQEMSGDLWELSYAFNQLLAFFPGCQIPRLFKETGKNPSMLFRVFTLLMRAGVLDFFDDPVPRIPNFTVAAERFLGERKKLVSDFVITCLLDAVEQGKLSACFNLIETLSGLGAEVSDALLWNALRSDVLNGTTERIDRAIASGRFNGIVGAERADTARYLFQTFNALVHGDESSIHAAFAQKPPSAASPLYEIQSFINCACYYVGCARVKEALDTLKQALRIYNDAQNFCPANIFRLLALVKLTSGKLDEAVEYISIALEHAEKHGTADERGVCAYYAATIQYLQGNLSKAERLALEAERSASIAGCYDWADRARFLRGKLRFEFGFYQDAVNLFEKTLENLSETAGVGTARNAVMRETLRVWIFRARAFMPASGSYPLPYRGVEISGAADGANLDALLFHAESAYLGGDYKTALSLCDLIEENVREESFLYTERPDWSSGFAQCELLTIKARKFWGRKASVFRSLSLCARAKSEEDKKRAVTELSWLSFNEVPSGTDTSDYFYFYGLYCVLRDTGAPIVDINTVVGMAFRRLQKRSLNIDDAEARKAFLNRPYWNGALLRAAKEYKLV